MALLAAASLFVFAGPASAKPRSAPACWRQVGAKEAERLVRDCREAAPKTPALCRPTVSCETLRELIADACRTPGAEATSACSSLSEGEDAMGGEEDDEDE